MLAALAKPIAPDVYTLRMALPRCGGWDEGCPGDRVWGVLDVHRSFFSSARAPWSHATRWVTPVLVPSSERCSTYQS